jgi:hypothetical protein
MRVAAVLVASLGCSGPDPRDPTSGSPDASGSTPTPTADVVGVRVTGEPSDYTFHVSVRSDETGCDRYADWWEVLTPEGALVYRRVLTHSHPNEQPFERSGGPVPVAEADSLVVRAHLHPSGYVGDALAGSVAGGFAAAALEEGFAASLATTPPLPTGCLF